MPATIGHGLRKRAASSRASNWVLSPISAIATCPVEIMAVSRWGASIETPGPGALTKANATQPGPGHAQRLPSVSPASLDRTVHCRALDGRHPARHGLLAKCVDAHPRSGCEGATPRRRRSSILQHAIPGCGGTDWLWVGAAQQRLQYAAPACGG